jgi:hypothetical protein
MARRREGWCLRAEVGRRRLPCTAGTAPGACGATPTAASSGLPLPGPACSWAEPATTLRCPVDSTALRRTFAAGGAANGAAASSAVPPRMISAASRGMAEAGAVPLTGTITTGEDSASLRLAWAGEAPGAARSVCHVATWPPNALGSVTPCSRQSPFARLFPACRLPLRAELSASMRESCACRPRPRSDLTPLAWQAEQHMGPGIGGGGEGGRVGWGGAMGARGGWEQGQAGAGGRGGGWDKGAARDADGMRGGGGGGSAGSGGPDDRDHRAGPPLPSLPPPAPPSRMSDAGAETSRANPRLEGSPGPGERLAPGHDVRMEMNQDEWKSRGAPALGAPALPAPPSVDSPRAPAEQHVQHVLGPSHQHHPGPGAPHAYASPAAAASPHHHQHYQQGAQGPVGAGAGPGVPQQVPRYCPANSKRAPRSVVGVR